MPWDNWRLLTVISLAGFLGLVMGQMMTFMFIAVLCYVIWLQRKWYQLWRWLQHPKKVACPSAEGVVDDVCRHIEKMRQQNSNRKKKVTNYLKRFQSATAALPDAIVIIGQHGQVDWANFSAMQLLGIRWPRDSGVRVVNLIRNPQLVKLMERPEAEGNVITLAAPLNPSRQLEIKLVSYMGNGRLLIARDITQTVKLQQMRRDFVANVSHELRTPLTVLKGYLESFEPASPAEHWQQVLPVMQQQTERMHLMIKDLLILSSLENGEKPLMHTPTNVGQLLEVIVDDAMRLEHYRQQPISLELNSEKWLMADVDELRSAISNLVFNAVKYTPDNCPITVSWHSNTVGATICIIDQGEGIETRHLSRLTERFYRVDKGRASNAGGTGLGLAIVKHVMQRHGGELTIDSAPGEGATFCCHFPLEKLVDKIDV